MDPARAHLSLVVLVLQVGVVADLRVGGAVGDLLLRGGRGGRPARAARPGRHLGLRRRRGLRPDARHALRAVRADVRAGGLPGAGLVGALDGRRPAAGGRCVSAAARSVAVRWLYAVSATWSASATRWATCQASPGRGRGPAPCCPADDERACGGCSGAPSPTGSRSSFRDRMTTAAPRLRLSIVAHRGGRAVRLAVRPALRPAGRGPPTTRCRPRPTGSAPCRSRRPGAASSTATARCSSTTG